MNMERKCRAVILAYNTHCEVLSNKFIELQKELNYIQCGDCKKVFKDHDGYRIWCKRCNKIICYRCSTLAGPRLNNTYCYSCVTTCESGSFCVNVRPMVIINDVQLCADCGCKLCKSCAIEHNSDILCTKCLADNNGLAKCVECRSIVKSFEAVYIPHGGFYVCTECSFICSNENCEKEEGIGHCRRRDIRSCPRCRKEYCNDCIEHHDCVYLIL